MNYHPEQMSHRCAPGVPRSVEYRRLSLDAPRVFERLQAVAHPRRADIHRAPLVRDGGVHLVKHPERCASLDERAPDCAAHAWRQAHAEQRSTI